MAATSLLAQAAGAPSGPQHVGPTAVSSLGTAGARVGRGTRVERGREAQGWLGEIHEEALKVVPVGVLGQILIMTVCARAPVEGKSFQ